MISVTCLCGRRFQVEDVHAGKPVRCPACGVRQVAPQATAVTGTNEPPDHFDDTPQPRPAGPRTSGAAIASLAMGVVSLVCGFLMILGIPAVITGLVAVRRINQSQGKQTGKGLAITGIGTGALSTLLLVSFVPVVGYFAWRAVREESAWAQSANNLRQIELAMENYHDTNKCYPPQATVLSWQPGMPPPNPNTPQPTALSWRVLLLPYLEDHDLYLQFNQNEPWDGPHNQALSSQTIKVYQMPRDTVVPANHTFYQVFVSDPQKNVHAIFTQPYPGFFQGGQQPHGPRMIEISDGMSNTILVAEAATAVPWAKPADISFDPDQPPPALGSHFAKGSQVITADGTIHALPKTMSPTTIKELITRDGGEMNTIPDWFENPTPRPRSP
jgi:hypothetical protein